MKNKNLIGTGIAVITPFDERDNVDFKALEKLIRFNIKGGVEYLVMLGTTAESVTLEPEEKKDIIALAKQVSDSQVPIVVGIGGNYTKKVIKEIENTNLDGISAILSVSPYYNKPTQTGILEHYKAISSASPAPIILYNVPGRTSSNMSADTTVRISHEVDNIIGIKEASGNFEQCMTIIRDKREDFLVISGDDAITLPLISIGMDGVISVVAQAFPRDFSDMVRFALSGNFNEARKLHNKLLPAMIGFFKEGNPGGVKAMLEINGMIKNKLRLPCFPVSDELYKELKNYKSFN